MSAIKTRICTGFYILSHNTYVLIKVIDSLSKKRDEEVLCPCGSLRFE